MSPDWYTTKIFHSFSNFNPSENLDQFEISVEKSADDV